MALLPVETRRRFARSRIGAAKERKHPPGGKEHSRWRRGAGALSRYVAGDRYSYGSNRFGGRCFLAFRALKPIRNLTAVTRSIIETARFDSRVPANRTHDELSDLVSLFNLMLEKIEILVQGMKDALDNVAHDLRTPVMRLRAIAEEALR